MKSRMIGGIDFIYIPQGSFLMGTPEGMGPDDEHPPHRVKISPFWIGKTEVTQEQYEGVMGRNPSSFRDPKRPVENVSWNDAMEFCKRFSMKNGVRARLPYEAEWEYAARAGTQTRYHWGDESDTRYAWFNANSGNMTNPAGAKLPNRWGLHDSAGNVWEWCMDWYDQSYYRYSPSSDPRGPHWGRFRVLRGGGWDIGAAYIRPTLRERNDPSNWNRVLGFRLAVEGLRP